MNSIRNLFIAFALLLGTSTFAKAAPNEFVLGSAEEEAAVAAQAQKAINLLDAGEHGKAWDHAAKPFQDSTSKPVFIAGIKSMRGLVGAVKTRSVRGIGFTKELQDAPAGHYAGVFFETTFANASALEERVVLFNQNGQWRLAGYFLKKRVSLPGKATK
ncbi:DUF4019 domain-containing protein [Pseudoduganella sp.]|uniref:DUF4019 domain-containing protein n=1 Tax=Pseudoduganella sp. TaxID=1880898 RepID=UPI0035B1E07D